MTAKKVWQDSDKLVAVIRELGKHGNVTQAMKSAKAARGWVYGRRQRDRFFRDAFEAARTCGIEVLKDEAHRRAYAGIEEPVLQPRQDLWPRPQVLRRSANVPDQAGGSELS